MSPYLDPEALALLLVQQYLSEQGHSSALAALEESSGRKYDNDKPRRGSELMELVYQFVQQQLAAEEAQDSLPADAHASTARHTRQQQVQQQHAKLQEELTLRSAAADYPSYRTHSLGPLPSNLLSVLMWPGEDYVIVGAADGTVRLLGFGEPAGQGSSEGAPVTAGGSSSSSREVWGTKLDGAGGVLTLAWHPAVAAGQCGFAAAGGSPHCLLLAGCMDGSVHILHGATGRLLASAKPHSKYVVAASWAPCLLTPQTQHHQQQQPQQQQGEQLIATASYDSSCCLLRLVCSGGGDAAGSHHQQQQQYQLEVVQQVPFPGYVQDVCFLPPGASGPPPSAAACSNLTTSTQCGGAANSSSMSDAEPQQHTWTAAAAAGDEGVGSESSLKLVVAVRGTNCLNILEVQLLRYAPAALPALSATAATAAATTSSSSSSSSSSGSSPVWGVAAAGLVNMSEAGDSHVSFSPMRLAVSPCRRYLLVASDSPILLVLRLAGWGVVRRLYGLDVDTFHNPSVAWHSSSSYIMAGAAHAAVVVYHLGTAKVVAQLQGHTVNVRAIAYDGSSNRLATCSFDKTVQLYEQP